MNIEKAKQLFFAQYLNQVVFTHKDWHNTVSPVDPTYLQCGSNRLHGGYLLLRSIEQLTDEEMIQVSIMSDADNEDELTDAENLTNSKYQIAEFKKGDSMPICFAQYLLRIGILLPFTYLNEDNKPITLSNDEIISKGWAKIQNHEQ